MERRIARLERLLLTENTDRDRELAQALCYPDWLRAFYSFAGILAARRFAFERGVTSLSHVDDWRELTTEDERETRIKAEVDRFVSLINKGDPIAAWTAPADIQGWPRLSGPIFSLDRGGFDQLVASHRRASDMSRGGVSSWARLWRTWYPNWHPNMSADQADEFDFCLIQRLASQDGG